MKKQHLLKSMLLLCALVVGSGSVWADPVTITWNINGVTTSSTKDEPCNTTLTTSSVTGGSGTWTASTGSNNCYSATDAGTAHFGSGKTKFNGTITLSSSSIPSDATISSITLDGTTNGTYTVSATVGATSFGSSTTFGNGTGCSFSGSVVGNAIVLTFSTTANSNVCISEITVTYSAEAVAVTGVSLPSNVNVAKGKTITLTPSFTPTTATNKNVTWVSKNTSVATVSDAGVVTGVEYGTADIEVTTEDGDFTAICKVTVDDGAINLENTGFITFNTFNGDVLGSGGYKSQDCDLTASNGNTYTWKEVDGYYNSGGWQIKNSTGKVTSPTIKSVNGFTIEVTQKTNNVKISDGTTTSTTKLTTTKTSTTITIQGDGAYAVFTGITITPKVIPASFGEGKTMISFSNASLALDFADGDGHRPDGLKAYKVSAANSSSVTLTEVTEAVKANTGLILTGSSNSTYNIPVVNSGSDISDTNKLVATDGKSTVSDAAVLSNGKLHPLTSGIIAAGKAYLPYANITGGNPFVGGAHALDIVFDNGDVTGIEQVANSQDSWFNGQLYDLQGRKVAQPTKGLYIVNGKKVIIK